MDQLPRLGKRELICLLLFTCNYVVFVRRSFLFLWVLGMDYVILLWHSLSLPYNYFEYLRNQWANRNQILSSKHHLGEDCLQFVLDQVGLELWFPSQQIVPIGLLWEKCCEHSSTFIFDRIFFILVENENIHNVSDEFEIRPDRTKDCGVSCP